MTIDLYTKIVLTVIATCLAAIVLRDVDLIPVSLASSPDLTTPTRVQVVTTEEAPLHVHLVNDSLGRTFEVKIRD